VVAIPSYLKGIEMVTDFYVAAPGESAPPVPDGPPLCDGQEMRILHDAFLWAYTQAPILVRDAAAGDTARSAVVGQWLSDLDATLHVHHEGEDELLWDKLERRAPACALHVSQMRAHHAQVQAMLHEAQPLRDAWITSADPDTGARLAGAYEQILAVLKVHLRREVVEVIPVVEKTVTTPEWTALAEHALKAIPRNRQLLQLGMLLANAKTDARAQFFAKIPAVPRFLYRMTGRRQFERQYRELFPGKPVPVTV
jgi:hypothetical protein